MQRFTQYFEFSLLSFFFYCERPWRPNGHWLRDKCKCKAKLLPLAKSIQYLPEIYQISRIARFDWLP